MNKRRAEVVFDGWKSWIVNCYVNGIFYKNVEFDSFLLAVGSAQEFLESGEIVSVSIETAQCIDGNMVTADLLFIGLSN
ncbi:hypothetical protein [Neisseria bergeri]|uniref:hypothetical protein n=1 Tax=Neisseria bergeri TaxID=1906581 RepID=UPI0027E20D44|nr:hypothetical protein [Neisseria bergeri]